MSETPAEMVVRDQQTQAEFDASAQDQEWLGWGIVLVVVLVVAMKAIRNGRNP